MKVVNDDLVVFFIYHSETDKRGNDKIKTAGQLIDQYVTMEGLFTIVLYAESEFNPLTNQIEYFFKTNSDGKNTAKSPYEMFDDLRIPNDLGFVSQKVREYYKS